MVLICYNTIGGVMSKYTKKQIKELKENPYTLKVDENRIFFTIDFKEIFWTKYQAGMSPRQILKELNYNLDYFGQKQIDSIVQRIKKEALGGEFTEGYNRKKRMKIKQPENVDSPQVIQHMQNELMYLKQEVDFLKKVLKMGKDP